MGRLMIAKHLESLLANAMGRRHAEMVQRFQCLRNFSCLPKSRGRNAEHLDPAGIVAGLCSIVSEKPGFAGVMTKVIRSLQPVGGTSASFGGASTFGEALTSLFHDEQLLGSLVEIRMTEGEVGVNGAGRGSIYYRSETSIEVAHYVRREALTLLQPGAERTYQLSDMHSEIYFEIAVSARLIRNIVRTHREGEIHRLSAEQHLRSIDPEAAARV